MPILAAGHASGDPDAVSGSRGVIFQLLGKGKSSMYDVYTSAGTGGTVAASTTGCAAGKTVGVTVSPKSGYELASIVVITASGELMEVVPDDDGYSFKMPSEPVVVDVTFQLVHTA